MINQIALGFLFSLQLKVSLFSQNWNNNFDETFTCLEGGDGLGRGLSALCGIQKMWFLGLSAQTDIFWKSQRDKNGFYPFLGVQWKNPKKIM